MQAQLSTLCYLERGNEYLMLHRVVKKNDVNKDKWIGVGGHFEQDESPEECLLREVREEILQVQGNRNICLRGRRHGIHASVHGGWIYRHPCGV